MPQTTEIAGGQYIVKGTYIGTDWEYPYAASLLGYGIRRRGERCAHRFTDGTVDCRECGKTAIEFISEARDIIDRHCD